MKNLKKNNKGFSLVELIVVVAIMAVLMGILVPVLVQNVEKSKRQKDISAVDEIRSAMVTTLASPNYSAIDITFSYSDGDIDIDAPDTVPTAGSTEEKFLAAVADIVDDYQLGSGQYKDLTVEFEISNGRVTATINNVEITTIDYNENATPH